MKLLLGKLTIALLFSCVASLGLASDEKIDKLLELSGLTMQVGELPGQFSEGMEQGFLRASSSRQVAFSSSELAEMKGFTLKAFQPEEILTLIRKSVANKLTDKEVDQLLFWYESATGRQITASEEHASTTEGFQEWMQQAQHLLQTSPRIGEVRRLEELMGGIDMFVEITEFSMIVTTASMISTLQPCKTVSFEEIKQMIPSMRPQLRENGGEMVLSNYLYMYQDIDNETFERYLDFLSTPSSRRFTTAVNDALLLGIKMSVARMADNMAESVKRAIKRKAKEEELKVAAYCANNNFG